MKKIVLLLCISLFGLIDTNAWVKVNYSKDRWRLFGYDYVQENFAQSGTNCSFSLTCNGSGFSGCKFTTYDITTPSRYGCQAIVVNNSNDDWVDVLNDDISDRIAAGYTSGTFVREDIKVTHPVTNNIENSVVVWTYSGETKITEMKIYSYNEAVELNIL